MSLKLTTKNHYYTSTPIHSNCCTKLQRNINNKTSKKKLNCYWVIRNFATINCDQFICLGNLQKITFGKRHIIRAEQGQYYYKNRQFKLNEPFQVIKMTGPWLCRLLRENPWISQKIDKPPHELHHMSVTIAYMWCNSWGGSFIFFDLFSR